MEKEINALLEKRMVALTACRDLNDKAESEKRDLTGEEKEQFERGMADVTDCDNQIKTLKDKETRSQFLASADKWESEPQRKTAPAPVSETRKSTDDFAMGAFRKFIRAGSNALNYSETRALSQGTDSAGGYLNPPTVWNNNLIAAIDNAVVVRQLATKYSFTGSDTLTFPRLSTDMSAPTWTTEVAGPDEDSSTALDNVTLTPQQLSKLVKVSMKLLAISNFPVEQLIQDRLAYQFAITLENGYLNGRGAATYYEPIGIFNVAATGHMEEATLDISTGNTQTAITADGLQNAKWDMLPQYHAGARWIFSPEAMGNIAKLKDGEGRYMWQPSLAAGVPDTLLGLPVDVSAYVPHVFTTGQYVGALCNWRGYYIADLQQLTVQRCVELYSGNSQIGFIARMYTDGKGVDSQAFRRIKLG